MHKYHYYYYHIQYNLYLHIRIINKSINQNQPIVCFACVVKVTSLHRLVKLTLSALWWNKNKKSTKLINVCVCTLYTSWANQFIICLIYFLMFHYWNTILILFCIYLYMNSLLYSTKFITWHLRVGAGEGFIWFIFIAPTTCFNVYFISINIQASGVPNNISSKWVYLKTLSILCFGYFFKSYFANHCLYLV